VRNMKKKDEDKIIIAAAGITGLIILLAAVHWYGHVQAAGPTTATAPVVQACPW
jgi:hypothetical protein